MVSRRDQLHSYQFLNQRVIAALVMRETDPAQSPLRRGVGAMFAGLMVAVIAAAGFGVYGLLTKIGSSKWKVDGTVVVEKETGAVFLYRTGVLHPMLNYASALLAAEHSPPAPVRVSRNSLAGVPRAVPLGIPYAPITLPERKKTLDGSWTVCAVRGSDGSGSAVSRSVLFVGRRTSGGLALQEAGLLVVGTRGGTYLIWRGHRYELHQPDLVVPSLFGAQTAPVTVPTGWLNAVPEGPMIGPITVPSSGSASTVISGRKVGDLLVAETGSGPQYYLLFDDGIAPISRLQKDIAMGQSATQPATITVSVANSARKSSRLPASSGDTPIPQEAPKLATPSRADDPICAEYSEGAAPVVTVGATASLNASEGNRTTGVGNAGTVLADLVIVPAGRVVVVRTNTAGGGHTGGYAIVTDIGVCYPVAGPQALEYLGYSASLARDVPAVLLDLVPIGPTLDVTAARQPAMSPVSTASSTAK